MKRINIFAKANIDVRDTLLFCREGGVLHWNGINDLLRDACPGHVARVRHETCARFDAILRGTGIPEELTSRLPPLQHYSLASQFESKIFDGKSDVVVLSLQADVTNTLLRHRTEGYLLYPEGAAEWPMDAKRWVREHFEPSPAPSPSESMTNLEALVTRLRATATPPKIVVFNLSFVVPGEDIRNFALAESSVSSRIRAYNLALCDLSAKLDLPVVDVDAVVARHGANGLKYDAFHLTPAAHPIIARQFVAVLADLGLLPP